MEEEIIVFIEKIEHLENGRYYLLLDFPALFSSEKNNNSEFNKFIERIEGHNFIRSEDTSMLELTNVNIQSHIVPREGSFYALPKDLLNVDLWRENNFESVSQNNYLAFSVNANYIKKVNFKKAHSYYGFLTKVEGNYTINELSEKIELNINNPRRIVFRVRDIGQGNLNEVYFYNKMYILYDIGSKQSGIIKDRLRRIKIYCDRLRKFKRLKEENATNIYQKDRTLIISHWDIDHYNGIFHLEEMGILDCFDVFILPVRIPNQTSERAYQKIKALNKKIISVEMRRRDKSDRRGSTLVKILDTTHIKLYKGSNSSDRNQSGIVLTIHKDNSEVIMPADHHYKQLDNFVIDNNNYNNKYLVVPHHGGNAGDVNLVCKWNNCEQAIISAGENQWGHPLKDNVRTINNKFSLNTHITKNKACKRNYCDYVKLL